MIYDRGLRAYFLIKFNLTKVCEVRLKSSVVRYKDKISMGSGLDEVPGNVRTEVGAQLKFKL